jgi:hypothetical protein
MHAIIRRAKSSVGIVSLLHFLSQQNSLHGHAFIIPSPSSPATSPSFARNRKRPSSHNLPIGIDSSREIKRRYGFYNTPSLNQDIINTEVKTNDENSNILEEDECDPRTSCYLDHYEDDGEEEDIDFVYSIPVTDSQKKSFLSTILIIPILTPIFAYMTYDDIASAFNYLFDLLALERNWTPVDGGAYQAKIIAPAINGIVVPAISILFATLTSNTVSTLRQRQIDIHTYLNIEAGDLRVLSLLVDAFPGGATKSRCRVYLRQYTSRLIAESQDSKVSKIMFGSTDSEMNAFVATLNTLCTDDEAKSRPPETILSESYGAVVRLNSVRSSRITALQSTYPVLHFAILGVLATSICVAFLLETNQELLIFLNAIQLRILWTMLIGSISALGVVCWDLSFPFTGSYVISNAVDQLKTIRDTLKAANREDDRGSR